MGQKNVSLSPPLVEASVDSKEKKVILIAMKLIIVLPTRNEARLFLQTDPEKSLLPQMLCFSWAAALQNGSAPL